MKGYLKKTLAFGLSLVMVFSMLVLPAGAKKVVNEADADIKVTIGSAEITAEKKSKVEVPVTVTLLNADAKFDAFGLKFNFDNNQFTMHVGSNPRTDPSVKVSDLLGSVTAVPENGTVTYADSYGVDQDTIDYFADSTLFTLLFDAADVYIDGEYEISAEIIGDLDGNFSYQGRGVKVYFESGTMTMSGGISEADLTPGVEVSATKEAYCYGETAPVLTATITDPVKTGTMAGQWYRFNFLTDPIGGVPIEGATGTTLDLSQLDLVFGNYSFLYVVNNTYNGVKKVGVDSAIVQYKKATLNESMVGLNPSTFVYNGEQQAPTLTFAEGMSGGDATASIAPQTNVGSYQVTINGVGNYEGSVIMTWTITAAAIGNVPATNAVTVYAGAPGESIKPTPVMKKGSDVATITYSDPTGTGASLIDFNKATGVVTVKNGVQLGENETKTATIKVTVKCEPDYQTVEQIVTVTIAGKKPATVTAEQKLTSVVYDAGKFYTATDILGAVTAKANDTQNNLTGGQVSYTIKDKTGNTVTSIQNAGTYTVTATYADTYYTGTSAAAEFVIAPKPVDVTDLDWDYTSAFQYDEQAHTVELKTVPEGLTVAGYTGNTGTDAKGYTASVTFNADSNHVVSGTPETLSWEISKRSVDVSGLAWQSETSFEYNKTEHSVVLVDPVDPWVVKAIKQIKYTDNAKTNAGTYTAKAELVANDNYVLTGTMPTPKSWTISTVKVTVPTAQNYTFASGQERMGLAVNDSDAYTVSGVNTATDAGTYNLTVTLKDTANYEWATSFDGKLTWTIAEAAFPKTTHDTSVRYDADKLEIDLNDLFPGYKSVVSSTVTNNMTAQIAGVEVKDGKLVIDVKPELPRPEVGQEPKGTIVLKIDTANYAEGTLTINLMVSSKVDVSSKIAFDLSNVKLTYNGKNQIDAVKTAAVKDAALKGTITYSISEAVNAGNYTIIATYEDADNYGTATQTFTIEQKDITITGGTVAAQEYDGDVTVDALTAAVVTGTENGESLTAGTDYEITNIKFADANVGTGKAVSYTVALKDTAKANNYKLTAATGATTGAVTAKSVTVTVADIAAVTYTGSEQFPTVVASATGTVNGYQLGSDDMVITYVNNKNAGTATVKVNPKAGSNYTFAEVTKNFTINKAQLAVSSVTVADKEYDGTNSAVVDSVTFTGLVNNETLGKGTDYSVTATFTGVNAGTGTATYTVALTDTAKAANYEITAGATGNTTANITQLQPQPKPVESLPTEEKITGETTLAKALDAVFGDVIDMLGGGSAAVKDKDGNVMTAEQMAETKVEANKEYEWIFTPAEKDKINVASTSGKITLYPQNAQAAAGGIVTVLPTTNGTVGVSTVYATMGTKVTVNVLPSAGYELSKLEVVSFYGKSIPVVQVADGKFTFVMPETAVTVKATFAKVGGARHSFVDVPAGSWFYTPVYYAYENGLMNGVGDGTRFAPGDNLTRGMLMTILARLDGVDTAGGATWYTKGMEWAKAVGISDGTMPEANITREQAVTMLFRYAQYKGVDVSVGENTNILSYDDAFQISEWAMPAMQWGCGSGMIQGNGGKVNPAGTASRAEIATMLMRFVENVMK